MGGTLVRIALIALAITGTAIAQTPAPLPPAPTVPAPTAPLATAPVPTVPAPTAPVPALAAKPSGAVTCAEVATCDVACKDGTGSLESCVRLGDLVISGRKIEPDAARALRAYRLACALDETLRPERDRGGVAAGCLAMWELLDRGWLFEVERSGDKAAIVLDRAIAIGRLHCTDSDTSGCAAAAKGVLMRDKKLPPGKADVLGRIALAERGCSKGRQLAACQLLVDTSWSLESIESFKSEAARLRAVANAGMVAACTTDDDVLACTKVEARLDGAQRVSVRSVIERRCKDNDKLACATLQMEQIIKHRREPDKLTAAMKAMIALCVGDGHPLCASVAEALLVPEKAKRLNIPVEPIAGLALAIQRCDLGDADGCRLAAVALAPLPAAPAIAPNPTPVPVAPVTPVVGAGSTATPAVPATAVVPAAAPALDRDPIKARGFADRACALTRPDRSCRECKTDPTLPSCQRRLAYSDHEQCFTGVAGACERTASRFVQGRGVARSIERAADYLRRGCDAAERGACVALDELCVASPALPATVCQQALIHSDLFYEAEYQLGAGGDAELIDPDRPATGNPNGPAPVTVGSLVAATPTSIQRGKLDADLVVNVVLDRLRQAAIQLVVDQLISAEKKARYRYLRDLLEQGAGLLAQPSTLRREKFQDLGMIVVRAFVAANLIDGLYPTGAALMASPQIGATVARGQNELDIDPKAALPGKLHGYLVDVAYYWLGETRLFGRPGGTAVRSLECPWSAGQGAILCTQLSERATAERVIGVDKVLDGLRLCKALRDGGFDDLRRLIEASSRSRTIADFGSTAGLTLDQWRARLVDGTRRRLDGVRSGLLDIRTLVRPGAFGDNGLDLATLAARARNAREALSSPAVRLSIGNESSLQLMRLVAMIDRATRDAEADDSDAQSGDQVLVGVIGPSAPPPPKPAAPTPKGKKPPKPEVGGPLSDAIDADALILAKLRQDASVVLAGWATREMGELGKRIDQINTKVDLVYPTVDRLEASVADIASLFARFPSSDGTASLDVGNLPLYATPDLARELRSASKALVALDDGLRSLFPGEVNAQVRFARSATVRLVGFLDLMERVARSSRLTQRTGDVIAALRMLGTFQLGVFDAPLYDVLEPVIASIKTHEPMSLEMLYSVIAHVRLDTLIRGLQGDGDPCKNEASVDCWTTRLVHALQESVEQDGSGGLRIDGGKFAQRLAQHGDDFRRHHRWRGYLHLTVGFGALYSDPLGDPVDTRRSVPLVSEQIGVGMASPSFFKDRLTFKVGTAASGLLYRAVLDSAESNAIMVHPLFFAMDIGDLVEAYVSPGMLMVYPPADGRGTEVRWGFSAGISVPIASYLERL